MLVAPASRRMVINQVAKGRHDAGTVGGTDLGAVLAEVRIADPVEPSSMARVAADDGGELGVAGLGDGQ
jgi:hypothetical protein